MQKSNFHPKVSIVIPVYNGSNYLEEAIDSALSQTYDNVEVIVVNDGSNDNGKTDKICKSYGDKIRYFVKENGGVATALNKGIEEMKGEYFSWLSHDDIYYPNKIEEQIKILETLEEKNVILYMDWESIDENGKFISKDILDHKLLTEKPEYALLRGRINGITLLIPKKAFKEYGLFDTSLRTTQDYDMWIRMFPKHQFVHIPKILTKTRIHSSQDTVTNPKVISEGNELWTRMIKLIPKERRIELEGTEYNFLKEMLKHLRYSPYEDTKAFLKNEMSKFPEYNIRDTNFSVKERTPIWKLPSKIIYLFKTQGILITLKKVIKKICTS